MKIVLLQPPVEDFYDTDIRLQPLGLCFLKAVLLERCPGVTVIVKDFRHGWGRRTVALPKDLHYLREFYLQANDSPFSTFNQYFHFGASFETVAEEVAGLEPDLVGISALFSPYYREVLRCAAAIKRKSGARIVVGGGQATCAPEIMLADASVDFVIRGEGERALVELVRALQGNDEYGHVKGLGFKVMGRLQFNPRGETYSLDELPMPDFSDLPLSGYLYQGKPIAFLQTSRGCPHRCAFCSVHQVFGRPYRRRSPEKIIVEMVHRYQQGYRVFDFEDDNLTLDKPEIVHLCRLIVDRFVTGELTLLAMNGVSWQSLDLEVLAAMRLAGFQRLNLALVSAAELTLKRLGRPHELSRFSGIICQAAELGFALEVHLIIGLPDDPLENMVRSITLLGHLPVLIGVSIFYLTPGTPIALDFPEMAGKEMFLARSSAMAIVSQECGRQELFTLFITARIINFLKGVVIAPQRMPVSELIRAKDTYPVRTAIGLELLGKLFTDKKFYAYDKGRFTEIGAFSLPLFLRVWRELRTICTQDGRHIDLDLL